MHIHAHTPGNLPLAGRIIAIAGAAMVLAWPVAAWWNPALLAPLLPPGVAASGGAQLTLLALSLVPAALFLGAMAETYRLFGLLGRGLAFTEAMPLSLQRLGYWALGCAATGAIMPTLAGLVATAASAEKQLVIRFGSGELTGLIVALLLLAFSRVMRDALALARENREFV